MAMSVGRAALGPPFKLLFDFMVKLPIQKIASFHGVLKRIKSTVVSLEPFIKQLKKTSEALDRPDAEIKGFVDAINKGKDLIEKCSKYSKWKHLHKRPKYYTKLQKFDEELKRLLHMMNSQILITGHETLLLLQQIHGILTRGTQHTNDAVSSQNELEECCYAPEPPAFTVGLNEPLQELKMKLLSANKSTVPVLVTAPPGCGKTTLAKMICKDHQIKEKFKSNILFVTVSKSPNLNLIVQQLHQHKGYFVPNIKDGHDAKVKLEQFFDIIGETPVLLVLDDVWPGSESLIQQNFVFPRLEYKILVTSRFQLQTIGLPYELKPLSDEHAMAIFKHYALVEDENVDIPDILLKKAVDQCKKVPLALKLIGSSLRGQHQRIWERELKAWSTDSSILFSNERELLSCLQTGLDVLDEKQVILK